MIRPNKPPSPSWRAFLDNHVKDLVSVDFFVVPTVTFRVLFVFVVLVSRSAPDRALQRDGAPDRPVDGPATLRGVSLGDGAPLPDPGSRPGVRLCLLNAGGIHGHRRSAHRPSKPLAESLCRAGNRERPSRVPGQRNRPRRAAPAEAPLRLLRALSPLALPPLARHGLPGTSACARARTRRRPGGRRSWRPLPSLRATRGLSGGAVRRAQPRIRAGTPCRTCVFEGVPARPRAPGLRLQRQPRLGSRPSLVGRRDGVFGTDRRP